MRSKYRRVLQRLMSTFVIMALLLGSMYDTVSVKAEEAAPAAIKITKPTTIVNTQQSYSYGNPIEVAADVTDAEGKPLGVNSGIKYTYKKSTTSGAITGSEVTAGTDEGSSFTFIPTDLDYNLDAEVAFIHLYAEYAGGEQTVKTPTDPGGISSVRVPVDLVADVNVAQKKFPVGTSGVTVTVKTAPQGAGRTITANLRNATGGALKDDNNKNIPAGETQGSGTLVLMPDGQYCEATFTVPIPDALKNRRETYRVQFRNTKYDTFEIADDAAPDTTPPTLANGYPKVDNITASTASLAVKTDKIGKAYYVVLPQGETAPTAVQVKAGQDSTGQAAAIAGSGGFTAGAEAQLPLSGLKKNTAYNVYVVAEDIATPPNTTAVQQVGFTTSSTDGAAFAFAVGYPKIGHTTADTVQLFVKTDWAGKAYYVVLPQTEPAPTAVQVKAGQDSTGQAAAIAGSRGFAAGAEVQLPLNGLVENIAYNAYVIAEDTATPPNVTALITVQVNTESAGSSAWSQAGQNPGSNYQGNTAGPASAPGLKWSEPYFLRNYTALKGGYDKQVAPVLLPDGRIWHAVTTEQGAYTGLLTNPNDGTVEENNKYTSLLSPVSKDSFFYGVVPADSGKQKIRRIDTASGEVIESTNEYFLFQNYRTANNIKLNPNNYYSYVLKADEHGIYVLNCLQPNKLSDDGAVLHAGRYEVVALDFNLQERWHYALPTGYSAPASPVIGADGSIYLLTWKETWTPSGSDYSYGVQDYRLIALTADGKVKWQESSIFDNAAPKEGAGPIVGANGALYVITGKKDGFGLYRLKDNGSRPEAVWSQPLPVSEAYQVRSAAVANDNTLYIATGEYNVLAYNAADGSRKWSYKTSATSNVARNLVIDWNGVVYVGTDSNYLGEVIALMPDGTRKWSYNVPAKDRFGMNTELMLGNGGCLYILTANGLYCIDGGGRTVSIDITDVNKPKQGTFYYAYGDTELRVKAKAMENGQPVASGITWYYSVDGTVYRVDGNSTEMSIMLPNILDGNKLGSVYALYGGAEASVEIRYVPNVPLFKNKGLVTDKNAYESGETIKASAIIKGRHGEDVTTGVTWFYTLDAPLNKENARSVSTAEGTYKYISDLTPSTGVEKIPITGTDSAVSFRAPATGQVMYLYASYDGVASPAAKIDIVSGNPAPPSITKAVYDSITGMVNVEGTVVEKGLTLKLTFTPKSGSSSIAKEFALGDTTQYRVAVADLAAGEYGVTAAVKRSREGSSYIAGTGAPVVVTVPAIASDRQRIQSALTRTITAYEKELLTRKGKFNDWEALALGTAGQHMQARKWLVDGKGYAYWRASAIADDKWGYNVGNSYPTTDLERTILGVLGAGYNPRDFNGTNLVAKLTDTLYPSGNFSPRWGAGKQDASQGNTQIFGIIALDAAKATAAEGYNAQKAVQRLLAMQGANGSFSWTGDVGEWTSGDIDSTGMALTALGPHRDMPGVQAAIDKAVAWLKSQQKAHGGFSGWGIENYPNPESSAWVIQGLIACGLDPLAPEWKKERGSLLTSLLEAQLDNGSFSHSTEPGKKSPNGMTTEQALLALGDLYNGKSKYSDLWSVNLPGYTLQVEKDPVPNRNDIEVILLTTQPLEKGKEQPVKINVHNKQSKEQDVTLLIGVYNQKTGKMESYKLVTETLAKNEKKESAASIFVPSADHLQVKAFVWDNPENMNILLEQPQTLSVAP
ncbi:PQQ-binding-like beta-propeller repeat protein [Aneurinibacillus aneurinilyticus]|nr:PQQ-binding-like beta-propeller repeat protein [Aneurinibacillus aneurinilyticus]MED0708296.1 PQQ-binding-like beta-propeller repeat protein [Aneurinibacillus aneurinilyticus]MED0722116.1 PQQ-binding-like beta-propeller repeat protein [Aneurinibacillus aneurinilyticus]MED0733398.1 PQQ-binding-like beta-propeller repeat protein [Aneurinibacillus aneurinilyticus]MED0741348.1 PQQ-binding-like beta-propeller repeat protein [Aneurinibacillus aneurinilyticus]